MRRNKLSSSLITIPIDGNLLMCSLCPKEYKTEKGLEKHIEDKHPDE